ncbi:MAG: hypothetical protein HZA46_03400 [Planctomycetales bacterium]|nr:hypothetical protein [Planctomycetales bacterium]
MARNEADREDLMREAVALTRRVEFRLPGENEPVVVGIRDNGCWSVYFGGDPVFHFDAEGRLRRAFVEGHLFRSQGTGLSRLSRLRSERKSNLLRYDLSPQELADFWSASGPRLCRLADAVRDGTARVQKQIPRDWELTTDILAVLTLISDGTIRLSRSLKK